MTPQEIGDSASKRNEFPLTTGKKKIDYPKTTLSLYEYVFSRETFDI